MTTRPYEIEKGQAVLAHDDLPKHFTVREFHSINFALHNYEPRTSKRMMTALREEGYIEMIQPPKANKLAVYRECVA